MSKDPYLQSNGVLKNKFGIKDKHELEIREGRFTSFAIEEILRNPIKGSFDFKHYCEFHKQIFQDIFEWAGQPRTIDIEKPEAVLGGDLSVEYAKPGKIKEAAVLVLKDMSAVDWDSLWLDKKAEQFAFLMGDLWKVHAFREGNTRTTALFCCQFAKEHGFPLNMDIFKNNSKYFRSALVAISAKFSDGTDVSQPEHLIRIVKDSMERGGCS
jgi:cell filamentation protein